MNKLNEFLSDPKVFGPGLWLSIHDKAIEADDTVKTRDFLRHITITSRRLRCDKCKHHCQDYIKKNPPELEFGKTYYVNDKVQCSGMFYWSWKFHNAVNKRLYKPTISLEEAYTLYTNVECGKGCKIIPELETYEDYIRQYNEGLITAVKLN